jgi:predicted DNA-binding transcriptional regulator YafY
MLSAEEAVAISVALSTAASTPFSRSARSAAQKVQAVLPDGIHRREELIAGRIHRLDDGPSARNAAVDEAVQRAVATRTVLRLAYTDAAGSVTERDVEPIGLLWSNTAWYLMGWCRVRGAVRGFRLDRIAAAGLTGEQAVDRENDMQAELRRLAAKPLEL